MAQTHARKKGRQREVKTGCKVLFCCWCVPAAFLLPVSRVLPLKPESLAVRNSEASCIALNDHEGLCSYFVMGLQLLQLVFRGTQQVRCLQLVFEVPNISFPLGL